MLISKKKTLIHSNDAPSSSSFFLSIKKAGGYFHFLNEITV